MQPPSASQIIAARALLGMSQTSLAEATGIGVATIRRFEAMAQKPDTVPTLRLSTLMTIVEYLEGQGVEFRAENDRIGVLISRSKA